MEVLVIGGGLAGPSLGISLKKLFGDAARVTIAEAYPKEEDEEAIVGSYFTLQDNGVDALMTLGALPEVQAAGVATTTSRMMRGDGKVLAVIPFGNSVTVKRGRVNHILMRRAAACGCDVRYNARVVSVVGEQRLHGGREKPVVAATFADGTTKTFDLVVGADGVHSMVRKAIDPEKAPEGRFVGLVNYAGVSPPPPADLLALHPTLMQQLPPQSWNFCFARNAFLLFHARPDGHIIWGVNEPRSDRVTKEERAAMTEASVRKHLLELFQDDANPLLTYLVTHGPVELMGDNQCDLGNVPKWSNDEGTMVVVGDAVHAPSPTSGQGASMAIEDGIVLAKALFEEPDIPHALRAYEAFRRTRVERIVEGGARMSKNKMPGRVGRLVRDLLMPLMVKCVDFAELNRWICDYRIVWDLPLRQQPPPATSSPWRAFRGGLIGVSVLLVGAVGVAIGYRRANGFWS